MPHLVLVPLEHFCPGHEKCCIAERCLGTICANGDKFPAVLVPANPQFEKKMRRQIQGAIKSAIDAHGPITKNLVGSVLKRLESQEGYRRLVEWNSEESSSAEG